MGLKFGVVTKIDADEVEEAEVKPLRRTEDVAHPVLCPTCAAPTRETATRTRQCPNCGTLPFER